MDIYCDSSLKENCIVIEGQEPDVKAYKKEVTNNVGEYKAVIRALELALTSGYEQAQILTDSKLVADQLNRLAKVKTEHLKPFHKLASGLLKKAKATIKWIPREKNLAGKVLG